MMLYTFRKTPIQQVSYTFPAGPPPPPGYQNVTVFELQGYLQTMGFDPSFHAFIKGAVATSALEVHDVAVTNLTSPKTVICQGLCGNLTVSVQNQGNLSETFNVTVYANTTTSVWSQNVTLSSGNSTDIPFLWNCTGFARGNYTIWAYAWPVQGETNTDNNNFTGGNVTVSLLGDLTGPTGWPDNKVDIKDISLVAKNFGKVVPPGPPNCDVTGPTPGVPDGKIDIKDVSLVAKNFGKYVP